MKQYKASDIRNIVLAGHGSTGKTTLAEAMLFTAKASDRLGKVSDGNTVMDHDAEEKKRKVSVSTAVAPLERAGTKINIIDVPGLFDFEGSIAEGIRAAETAVIVLSCSSGLTVGAEKSFKSAGKRGIARSFVINKVDRENANFYKTLQTVIDKYGTSVCPAIVPIYEGDRVTAYADLITQKAFKYEKGAATEIPMPEFEQYDAMMSLLTEAVASADDELMEKFFEGEAFTAEEVQRGLKAAMEQDSAYPVFACSGQENAGVDLLLFAIAKFFPAPDSRTETAVNGNEEEVALACDENGPLAAIAFKTIADPFIGKMTFFKVVSGKITPDVIAYNSRTEEEERLGKIAIMRGAKQEDSACIPAGDIGVVTKLSSFRTGDTLCRKEEPYTLGGVVKFAPSLSMAIKTVKKGEEAKATAGLLRLIEEDPRLSLVNNTETHEQVLSGLGEQHLDVAVSKLKNKFGVEVTLQVPKVAYRETITKKISVQGRHKKQSGGSGQFGDVWVEFEPTEEDFIFAERVVGGSVPKNYFPAVEKGLRECIQKGVLAGYPMVGLKATLYDGSYHSVDSNDMAFKTAASIAYRNGIPKAGPVILEPIGTLKAHVNDDVMGDIIGDVNKRRGRVLGMNPEEDNMQEVVAEVPMAEMGDFSTALRQITQGRGYYTLNFERYERAPEHIAQKVIDAAAKED